MRQLHPPARLVVCARDEARLRHCVPPLLEARRRDDHSVDQLWFVLIVLLAERCVVLVGDGARGVEHGIVHLTPLAGEARTVSERVDVE